MSPLLPAIAAIACVLPVEHPISVTQADFYMTQTGANLQLQLFAEDVDRFLILEQDPSGLISPEELKQGIEDYKTWLQERVVIRDAKGEPIPGKLVNMQSFDIPPGGVEVAELMKYKLTYQYEYKFDEPPEFLTFETNISDDDYTTPSEFQLSLKQSGSKAIYSRTVKPGEPHTPPRFDWSNPPLSEDATEKEWEEWVRQQRENSLGITDYSSVYSFIYITDYEVRHEILIPVITLATIFEIERKDESWLEVEEQDKARAAIKKYFGTGNPVSIDGVEVQPVFDRIDFHALDLRDFAMMAPSKRVSMASGRVGIIMSYSTKGTPNDVKVKWTKFSPNVKKIKSVVFAFEDTDKYRFSKYSNNNEYHWVNPGREPRPEIATIAASLPPKPMVTVRPVAWSSLGVGFLLFLATLKKFGAKAMLVLLVGAGVAGATWSQSRQIESPWEKPDAIADKDAQVVFETLHRNVYRAFDYGTEDEVYDALDASVSGELLKDIYLNIRKSLEVREQGGAMARISEVKYGTVATKEVEIETNDGEPATRTATEFIPAPGVVVPDPDLAWPTFQYRSSWMVSGSIEHWGHIHERANQFDGVFTVKLEDGNWKITDFEIMDEKRVKATTNLRRY